MIFKTILSVIILSTFFSFMTWFDFGCDQLYFFLVDYSRVARLSLIPFGFYLVLEDIEKEFYVEILNRFKKFLLYYFFLSLLNLLTVVLVYLGIDIWQELLVIKIIIYAVLIWLFIPTIRGKSWNQC